jgi:hypothetical protein
MEITSGVSEMIALDWDIPYINWEKLTVERIINLKRIV